MEAPLALADEGEERQEVTWWLSWARAEVAAAAMVVVVETEDAEVMAEAAALEVGLLLPPVKCPNV